MSLGERTTRASTRAAAITVALVGVVLVAASVAGAPPRVHTSLDAPTTAVRGTQVPSPAGSPDADPPSAPLPTDLSPDCVNSADAMDRADGIMANRYRFGKWPAVTLSSNLSWTENPFHDNNWMFQEHNLRWVLDLYTAGRATGDPTYAQRGFAILQDWIHDNPRFAARSIWAWNDHTTALRAVVLACTADLYEMTSWLRSALTLHGTTLASDSFYRHEGNHALNQSIGLLEVGRVLNRSDWTTLAQNRINALLLASVDSQGVTNEQSVGYEIFNWKRYTLAKTRLLATGLVPGSVFGRLDRMPTFLAHATLPNGTYEMIGDTYGGPAPYIAGTVSEYAATRGASGPKPTTPIARYAAGYLFVRSGWGEVRDEIDETFFSTKWGPGPVFHGHADGMQLTVAGYGSRLLLDSGLYSYTASPIRAYFKSRQGHNVVTVDGLTWNRSTATKLLGYQASAGFVDVRLGATGYAGVRQTRRITYSRGLDYLIVDDSAVSSTTHTYRQLWHFPEDARPAVGVRSVWTQRAKGNVIVRQLLNTPAINIVRGRTSPVQGWLSYQYGTKVAAPVEEAVLRGRSVRYITLIAPSAGKPVAKLSAFRATSLGYTVTVAIGGHSERVTVSGSSVWVTRLS